MAAPVDESCTTKEGDEEIPTKIRNILLVVVTLVASVTFSAGVNPPGGVWQDNNNNMNGRAGNAILASSRVPYCIFIFCNTVAFTTSGFVIWRLVSVYPFRREICVAIVAMSGTYAAAITAVTPAEIMNPYIIPVFVVPLFVFAFNWLRKRIWQRLAGHV